MIKSAGGDAIGIGVDISSSQDVQRMFQRMVERYGTLDIRQCQSYQPNGQNRTEESELPAAISGSFVVRKELQAFDSIH
jgi:hypothetical protein